MRGQFFKNPGAPIALLVLLAATLFIWLLIFPQLKSAADGFYFFQIGQGDSQLIVLPARGGQAGDVQILIDGGPSGQKLLGNLATVLPSYDRYIDLVIMTHPQLDHFAGFVDLLSRYEVGAFISAGRQGNSLSYTALIDKLQKFNLPYIRMVEGDRFRFGDSEFLIFGPSKTDWGSKELNDSSVVVYAKTPDLTGLFTGDIGFKTEERLAREYDLPVQVLKVAHHGSRFSSSEVFLKDVQPQVAVIGVGKNTYGHPTAETLARLKKWSGRVLRTDLDGLIKITAGENGLKIFTLASP